MCEYMPEPKYFKDFDENDLKEIEKMEEKIKSVSAQVWGEFSLMEKRNKIKKEENLRKWSENDKNSIKFVKNENYAQKLRLNHVVGNQSHFRGQIEGQNVRKNW